MRRKEPPENTLWEYFVNLQYSASSLIPSVASFPPSVRLRRLLLLPYCGSESTRPTDT